MFKKFAQIIGIIAVLATMFTLPVQAASINTISGTITLNGKGLKGVVVSLVGTKLTGTTNGAGNYSIHDVPAGTNGTLTPKLANYSFSPTGIKVTNVQSTLTGENFTATQLVVFKYSISGKITKNGKNFPGVKVTFGTYSAVSGAIGTYTIKNIPAGSKGRIVASLAGYAFTPSSITITALNSNLSGKNFTGVLAYTISGKVTDKATGLPLGGVTVTFGTYSAVSSSTTGAYTIRNVPAGTAGMLTPSLSGKTFTPTTITLAALKASLHSQNFVAEP